MKEGPVPGVISTSGKDPTTFLPPRQLGLITHSTIVLILALIAVWGFLNLSRAEVGPTFTFFLLVTLISFAPLPLFVYRMYALLRASYNLSRENLAIHWGLRMEDIPLSDIEWIRPASDLTSPLKPFWFSLPGAYLGLRRHPDLGIVEFIASDMRDLLLIATARRVFAISPTQAAVFVQTFQRSTELGSLISGQGRSIYPSFLIARAWDNLLARYLWLSGLLLDIGLFIWVSLVVPSSEKVSLGFSPTGASLQPVPVIQLMLLPIISSFLLLIGWMAGLYYYRFPKQQVLAFIIWGSSLLSILTFLLAVLFITTTPV